MTAAGHDISFNCLPTYNILSSDSDARGYGENEFAIFVVGPVMVRDPRGALKGLKTAYLMALEKCQEL